MIISENRKPPLEAFRALMGETDKLLNNEAKEKEKYYSSRNGTQLEEDVFEALCRSAKDTPFENTIQLVSGASFPDIVASKFYGVEVKSTNKNHWKSIGSSILESTRDQSVERIFRSTLLLLLGECAGQSGTEAHAALEGEGFAVHIFEIGGCKLHTNAADFGFGVAVMSCGRHFYVCLEGIGISFLEAFKLCGPCEGADDVYIDAVRTPLGGCNTGQTADAFDARSDQRLAAHDVSGKGAQNLNMLGVEAVGLNLDLLGNVNEVNASVIDILNESLVENTVCNVRDRLS